MLYIVPRFMKFYSFIFFLFVGQIFYSQNIPVKVNNIYHKSKSLQFGEDLKFQNDSNLVSEETKIPHTTVFTIDYTQKYLVYDPVKDPKRLLYNTGLFMGTALASFGILWILPESFTNWNKEEMLEYGMLNRWKDNVRAGPVWDKDGVFLNWILHPWAGAVYFMSARGSGYNKWESFAYSTVMSAVFWEYGVEAFAEIPSWQDLLVTPIIGSVMGEFFYVWKGNIIRSDRRVLNSRIIGGTALFIMDPFNMILDGLGYKTKHKMQIYSSFSPINYDFISNKTIWGMQVVVGF